MAKAECPKKWRAAKIFLFGTALRRTNFSRGFQVVRNKALAGPKMGIQKVAAHETFAGFLRLYL
jgi:hypothetical protein